MNSEATGLIEPRAGALGFWTGLLIACVLVAIWTPIAAIGITFPTLQTAPPDPTSSFAYQLGAVARAPLMAGFVVWALSWALFWRLPSLRSALLGLALLIAVAVAIAMPVRSFLAPSLSGEDVVAVNLIQSTTSQLEGIVSRTRESTAAIGLNSAVPESGWTREFVETKRNQLQQALPIMREAMAQLESAQRTNAAAVAALEASDDTRSRVVEQLEWVVGPSPSVIEQFRSELLLVEKLEEQFAYLGANSTGWDSQNGQIAFRSERVYRRFNLLGQEVAALMAARNATTEAMEAKRQSSLASSPFNTTPRLFELLPPSSVEQIKRISSWSYLLLTSVMMSVVAAALCALLAMPIMKISARSVPWGRTLTIALRSFLPAMLGMSLTYAVYVIGLGRRTYETPAFFLMAWFVLAGWLISQGMKKEGVVRSFPGIGTRVVFGLVALSWVLAGLASVLGWATSFF